MLNETNKTVVINPGKSVLVAGLLTFFFGPIGMFYSTVIGAIIMLVLYVAVGIITLGFGLIILHPIAIIWACLAVSNHNEKLINKY
jgi:hypothetical protein